MNESSQNLNQDSDRTSVPSFLKEGMKSENKHRRDSSDPEDIFNPNDIGGVDSDEADEEKGAIQMPGSEGGFAYYRGLYMINITDKVTTGKFLPVTILIEKGHIDPKSQVVDHNSGAMIPHYAAHHGNLKFLRYLASHFKKTMVSPKFVDKNFRPGFPDFKDNYDCNLGHYAVRQGHLPIMIYLADVLHIDLNQRDKFGYSPLEYSIVYKKLNCFIYLLYNRGMRTIKPELVESIAQGLFTEQAPGGKDYNSIQDSSSESTTSFKIIQIFLREPDLCKIFAPIFLINSIKFNRVDILQEVAHRAYFFPKMALKDQSSMDIPQAISDEQMQAVLTSLPSIVHVDKTRGQMGMMAKALKGYDCEKFNDLQKNGRCCYQFGRSIKLFLVQTFGLLVFYYMYCQISEFPVSKDDGYLAQMEFQLKFPFSGIIDPESEKLVIQDKFAYSAVNATKFEAGLEELTSQGYISSLLIIVLFLVWSLANAFLFLFTNNGQEAMLFDKPYMLGDAPQVLASHMTMIDPQNGDMHMKYIETISQNYDEICFKYFIFKTHQYDYEPKFDNYVKENHGWSDLFMKSINRTNFRFLVLNTLFCNLFFFAGFYHMVYYQKVYQLQASGKILRLCELHILACAQMFTGHPNFIFGVTLCLTEALFAHTYWMNIVNLYVVGRQMTRLELKSPWLYTQTRIGSVFKRCEPKYIPKPPDEIEVQCFGHKNKVMMHQCIDYERSGIIWNICNVLKFLVTINWSVRSQELRKSKLGSKSVLTGFNKNQPMQSYTVYGKNKVNTEIEMQGLKSLDETQEITED